MRISWLIRLIVAFGVVFSIIIVFGYNNNIMVKIAISTYYLSGCFVVLSRKASYATLLFLISSILYHIVIFSNYFSESLLNTYINGRIHDYCKSHARFVADPEAADWDLEVARMAHRRFIEDGVLYYRLLGLLLFSLISTSIGEVIDIWRRKAGDVRSVS